MAAIIEQNLKHLTQTASREERIEHFSRIRKLVTDLL